MTAGRTTRRSVRTTSTRLAVTAVCAIALLAPGATCSSTGSGAAGSAQRELDALDLLTSDNPDPSEGYLHRGLYYLGAGRYEEALTDLREADRLAEGRDEAGGIATWVEELIASVGNPMCMPDYILELFAGDYGPRHVRLRDHRLYYQRDDGEEFLLSAMDEYTFRLEGLDYLRLRFVADGEAPATKIVGLYMDGRRDESLRSPTPEE